MVSRIIHMLILCEKPFYFLLHFLYQVFSQPISPDLIGGVEM